MSGRRQRQAGEIHIPVPFTEGLSIFLPASRYMGPRKSYSRTIRGVNEAAHDIAEAEKTLRHAQPGSRESFGAMGQLVRANVALDEARKNGVEG